MNKILTIMWKDVNILFRDWAAVILIIAGPLVLTVGMGLVTGSFSRSDAAPSISLIPVVILDQDGGQFAEALVELFTGEGLNELVSTSVSTDEASARAQVEGGDAAAAIIIPPGFSNSFVPDMASGDLPDPVPVEVYADPGSPIRAGIIRGIVDEFAGRAQIGVSSVQIGMNELAAGGLVSTAELPSIGQAMGGQLLNEAGSEALAAGSLIAIRNESAVAEGSDDFNPLAYFAPAMALLFLMYAVTLGARTLLAERREGTLARMLAAPVTSSQVLSGKVAGIFLGGVILLGVLIFLTTILFRLNWGNPLGVVMLVLAAAAAATGWGLLIAATAKTPGQISNLGMAITLIFGILGGSFVPLQGGASLIDWLSRLTPNRWALDGFTNLALGEGLAGLVVPISALLIMAVTLFAAAAFIFRRSQSALLSA
jgi:ABC-2 type transport system permease protein